MLKNLKRQLRREAMKPAFECAAELLHNKEPGDEYIKDKTDDAEIAEIADSLPLTDELNQPDVDEVIESFIPKSRL